MAKKTKKNQDLSKLSKVWLVSDSPKGELEQGFKWDHAEKILQRTGNKAPGWRLRDSHQLEFKENALSHKPSQRVSGESKESKADK